MKIPFVALAGLSLLALLGTTGPREDVPDADDEDPRIVQVKMIDKGGGQWRFEPANLTASRGDVIRFVQADVVPHNVEFKDGPEGTDLADERMGPFLLKKGDTYDVTIDDRFAPGTHKFVCTPHAMLGMVGTLEVKSGT